MCIYTHCIYIYIYIHWLFLLTLIIKKKTYEDKQNVRFQAIEYGFGEFHLEDQRPLGARPQEPPWVEALRFLSGRATLLHSPGEKKELLWLSGCLGPPKSNQLKIPGEPIYIYTVIIFHNCRWNLVKSVSKYNMSTCYHFGVYMGIPVVYIIPNFLGYLQVSHVGNHKATSNHNVPTAGPSRQNCQLGLSSSYLLWHRPADAIPNRSIWGPEPSWVWVK